MNDTLVRYRVGNWSEYNQSLIDRGNVELWFNDDVLSQWTFPLATGKRGRPRIYSDVALQCLFALRLLYHLPLRATQGLFISLLRLLGCAFDRSELLDALPPPGPIEPGPAGDGGPRSPSSVD